MIDVSDVVLDALTRSHRRLMSVDSWLGPTLLRHDIPFATGSEDSDADDNVPESATFTIPRTDATGFDWSPGAQGHPLNAGNRLRVSQGIDLGADNVEWFTRGWFRIHDSTVDGDLVTVQASGFLDYLDQAKYAAPFQPIGNFTTTVRALCGKLIQAYFDDDLTDKDVPDAVQLGDDRLQNLYTVMDAWPAQCAVDEDGRLFVTTTVQSREPVISLTHERGGTVIKSTGTSTLEGAYNCVVSRGADSDGRRVQGVAYNQNSSDPMRFGGPIMPEPVPFIFESELIQSLAQARKSAASILTRKQRSTSKAYGIEMVPNPVLQLGDVLEITTEQVTNQLAVITSLAYPYTETGTNETMSLTVRTI